MTAERLVIMTSARLVSWVLVGFVLIDPAARTRTMSTATSEASAAGLHFRAVRNATEDHTHASAFGDLLDNPFEAGARHIHVTRGGDKRQGEYLVISDDGPGLADFAHLERAYTFGCSPVKGDQHNYGQGEKAAGLQLGGCLCKLCDLGDARLIAMLSAPMQTHPAFPRRRSDRSSNSCATRAPTGWRLNTARPSASANADLLFTWSPFADARAARRA